MSETNAQEPTMEEILASIRRIISEDDAPLPAPPEAAAEPTPTLVAPSPPPTPAPPASMPASTAAKPSPPVEEDVLELTEPLDMPQASPAPPQKETLGDLDVFSSSPAPPPPHAAATPAPVFKEEPLLGSYAAEQTAGHFGALARSLAMPRDGRTLEDVVRELLKPMLRDWLDTYLPAIVEARVQAEVERVSRRQDY